jgi:hypothetical protein
MFSSGVAGMLGRPDLASGYGYYLAAPTAGSGAIGSMGQVPLSGGSVLSGNLSSSISGGVATGQLSLGLVAMLVIMMFLFYFWTRSHQH